MQGPEGLCPPLMMLGVPVGRGLGVPMGGGGGLAVRGLVRAVIRVRAKDPVAPAERGPVVPLERHVVVVMKVGACPMHTHMHAHKPVHSESGYGRCAGARAKGGPAQNGRKLCRLHGKS
jgi:hypothetical protein